MKTRIEALDKAYENHEYYGDIDMNRTLQTAYLYSLEAGNELPNFGDVIWDDDIEAIIADCRKYGITEFTISSTFSSLIQTVATFEESGCKLDGIVKINSRFSDWHTGEKEIIPAFKMILG